MMYFLLVLLGLLGATVITQLVKNMKLVGGNELGVVSGKGSRGFVTLSGGRVFIIPLLNQFAAVDLTPHTLEVVVESAIAEGVVPLNVKATVSFAISGNEAGRARAVTRILRLATDIERLRTMASSIIEGHLRDAIASMTPEQVMQDKDTLVARMINVCKNDLENIGLEITTMNIADVDDHRLPGIEEPDLYIALLKRIQTANAEAQARQAQAEARAAAEEEREARRADVEVRSLENQYEKLVAETRLRTAAEHQRRTVGMEKARQNASAQAAGLKAQIEAEKQMLEVLRQRYEAEILVPAQAEKERTVLAAQAEASRLTGRSQGLIDQLKTTLAILDKQGPAGRTAYVLENFQALSQPLADSLSAFPVDRLTILSGPATAREPLSAIHPNAVAEARNQLAAAALEGLTKPKGKNT